MLKQGFQVSWVSFAERRDKMVRDGISFVSLPTLRIRIIGAFIDAINIVSYCLGNRVNAIYCDEWLFHRFSPGRRLLTQFGLKLIGVKFIIEQRDPFIDFQLANGRLQGNTTKHKILKFEYELIYRLTDLIILPSQAYSQLVVHDGVPKKKVLGIFRGVDPAIFRPIASSEEIISNLKLDGKFVIGWFGMLLPHRGINEIFIPLIEEIKDFIPNSVVLVGGRGALESEFRNIENMRPGLPFKFIGLIPYEQLPSYIAACDVLLCPVNPTSRFAQNSAWLKIAESLSVGKPVVATRTKIAEKDFKGLEGVIWVDSDPKSFLYAIKNVYDNKTLYNSIAEKVSMDFEGYTIGFSMPKIVDSVKRILASSESEKYLTSTQIHESLTAD